MARQISQLAQVQRTVPHAKVAVPVNTAARMAGPVVFARRENRQHDLQDKILGRGRVISYGLSCLIQTDEDQTIFKKEK